MNNADLLEQRRQARAAKLLADSNLLDLHRLAADALLDPVLSKQVREHALRQIDKWDSGHLCSIHYVQAWRHILSLPAPSIPSIPSAIPAAILRQDAEGTALRQNSPFGFLVNRAAS
jgi:hypothetical protein